MSLKARFGEFGSTGTWNITDAWGWYEDVKGSGSLTGTSSDIGIDDRYAGSVYWVESEVRLDRWKPVQPSA